MRTYLITAFIAVVVSALTAVFLTNTNIVTGTVTSSGTEQRSHLEKVQQSGLLRAAYAVGSPLFVIDPNTKTKSGVFHDILEEAANRLGLSVDWSEEVGYGEMIQGLKNGRYDIVGSGVWINSSRAKGASFTRPAYYDAVFAYSAFDDDRFNEGLDILNSKDYTISTMDGELGAAIALSSFPKANTLALPQFADFSQMILNVVTDKADIVFLASAPARSFQEARPNTIKIADENPVRIFPNAFMLPQGSIQLKNALNFTLGEMLNDGTIETILKRYESSPGLFLRIANPYLN